MGCCGCNKKSLKGSIGSIHFTGTEDHPNKSLNKFENEESFEGNQFNIETENPINNNEINDKEDINIEKQQKYNENNIQYPPYEEEAGIIDSQIRTEKV